MNDRDPISFFKLYKNVDNRKDDINYKICENDCFDRLYDMKYIGGGAFGSIFKAKKYLNDGKTKDIIVKFILPRIRDYDNQKIKMKAVDNWINELKYSIAAADENIGPKILETQLYLYNKNTVHKQFKEVLDTILNSDSEFKNIFETKLQNINNLYFPFFEMEKFDMDCDDVFYNESISDDLKLEMIIQMKELIHKKIFIMNLYCSDIKPANFVVKMNINPVVRMIDFGENSCSFDRLYDYRKHQNMSLKELNERKKYLYFSLMFQLFVIITNDDPEKLIEKYKFSNDEYVDIKIINILFGDIMDIINSPNLEDIANKFILNRKYIESIQLLHYWNMLDKNKDYILNRFLGLSSIIKDFTNNFGSWRVKGRTTHRSTKKRTNRTRRSVRKTAHKSKRKNIKSIH